MSWIHRAGLKRIEFDMSLIPVLIIRLLTSQSERTHALHTVQNNTYISIMTRCWQSKPIINNQQREIVFYDCGFFSTSRHSTLTSAARTMRCNIYRCDIITFILSIMRCTHKTFKHCFSHSCYIR